MKPAKLAVILQHAIAQVQLEESLKRCPPHNFQAGWVDNGEGNAKGAIFCVMCGDIRPLEPVGVGAPIEESIPAPLYRPE